MSDINSPPTPTDLEVICTKGLTDDQVAKTIQNKQAEILPETTLVIFTRVPLTATLTPAPKDSEPAQIDVKVNRDDISLFGIDDLLGYFHQLVDVYAPSLNVNFEIVGGNSFSEKLSDLYDHAPSDDEVMDYVSRQQSAVDRLGLFNEAVSLMRESGDYNESNTEEEVLDWYARVGVAATPGVRTAEAAESAGARSTIL